MPKLVYVATQANLDAIGSYLDGWGRDLKPYVEPMDYETLLRQPRLPRAVYIFAAWGGVAPALKAPLQQLWAKLAVELPAGALLNNPARSMRRYDLARALLAAGINRFDVMRADEDRRPACYPVFVRPEAGTLLEGMVPRLFHSIAELEPALRGTPDRKGLLIVEHVETADANGIHRKYGAFCIAGRVIPRHLFFSRNWVVKAAELLDEPLLAEEREFVATNPHADAIRRIFALAHIDYGRIDYWIDRDGAIQVFEINTNPMIVTDDYTAASRAAQAAAFARAYNAALIGHATGLGL